MSKEAKILPLSVRVQYDGMAAKKAAQRERIDFWKNHIVELFKKKRS